MLFRSNVGVAIIDRDEGRWSYELTERVTAAGFVSRVYTLDSEQVFRELVDRRSALFAIVIPADFSATISRGGTAPLQVLFDGRRANSGQIVLSYLSAIVGGLNVELRPADMVPQVAIRHWFNPNLQHQWFIVPALGAALAMMMSLLMTSLSIAREREQGTFDQVLVSPLRPTEIILSKTLPALAAGSFLNVVVLLMAVLFFGVPFIGNLGYLLIGILVFQLAFVGVGLSVSALANNQQQAFLAMFSMMPVLMTTSGFMTPVENMPVYLQWLAETNPLKHALVLVHGVYLKNMGFKDLFTNLWPLAAIALVSLVAAAQIVRRRLH